jgi:hypothetical protein
MRELLQTIFIQREISALAAAGGDEYKIQKEFSDTVHSLNNI